MGYQASSASLVVDQDQQDRFNDFTTAGLLNSREVLLDCPRLAARARLGSFGGALIARLQPQRIQDAGYASCRSRFSNRSPVEARHGSMKFKLKSMLTVVAFVALLLALWLSHERTRRRNFEAAELASEIYRKHLLRELEKPYGSFFPPGWNAIVSGQGDVVDVTTVAGRADLLVRIKEGKTDFRIRCQGGYIMQQKDLLTEPYPLDSWQQGKASSLLGFNASFSSSDNRSMQRSGNGGDSADATISPADR